MTTQPDSQVSPPAPVLAPPETPAAGPPVPAADQAKATETSAATSSELDPGTAHLVGWLAVAAVNAIVIAVTLPLRTGGLGVRIFHHLYDAAQLLGAGLVTLALVRGWRRFGPRSRWLAYAAVGVVSLAFGVLVLVEDFDNFASRVGGALSVVVLVGSVVAGSASIPIGARVARALARRWLRLLGIVVGFAIAVVNHWVLWKNYPGVHLYALWLATILIGSSLSGMALPARLVPKSPRVRRAVGWTLSGVAAIAAAWSFVTHPRNAVVTQMVELPGCALAPFVLRMRLASEGAAYVPEGSEAWFKDRSNAPPIAPTSPPLLADPPVVILVTIDCARADVFTDNTHAKELPHLFAIRNTGVQFTHAVTTAPATAVSLSAIFSSHYYSQLYWRRKSLAGRMALLPATDSSPRFPQLLSDAGVTTVTVLGTETLVGEGGLVRGFTEEDPVAPEQGQEYAPAADLASHAIERIRTHREGPLFLYVHFLDAHAPYDRGGRSGTQFQRYVKELGVVDKAIGRILGELEESGLAGRSVVMVTADHGEAFGEHHTYQHGVSVYEELTRVPLLVRAPGLSKRRIDEPVSLIDLGPTILDLFGQKTPGTFMGQSLVPLLRSGKAKALTRPLAVDSGRLMQVLYFKDGAKVIWHKRERYAELYDLKSDPEEKNNLFDNDESAEQRLATLRAFFNAHELRRRGYRPPYRPP